MATVKEIMELIGKDEHLQDAVFQILQGMKAARRMTEELLHEQEVIKMGAMVKFDARTRGIIHGIIIKINKNTVKVKTPTGQIWSVSKPLIEKDA